MTRRSVSQLKLYSQCSERYFLERVMKPKPESRPAAWFAMGTALHKAYQQWELQNRPPDDLAESFNLFFDQDIRDLISLQPDISRWFKRPTVKSVDRDIELYRSVGQLQAAAYEDHCRVAQWDLFTLPGGQKAVEVEFEIDIGGVPVVGYIDSIQVWPSGAITVRDIKTGNQESSALQLGVYRYAMNQLYSLDIQYGEFWYTKNNEGSGWFDLTKYNEKYLTHLFTSLNKGIKNRVFLPSPGDFCKFCSVRELCSEKGSVVSD